MAALSPYVVISLYTLKSDYNYNWPSPHSSSYLDTSDIRFCKNISPNIWEECLSNCSKYSKFIKLTSKMSLETVWIEEVSKVFSFHAIDMLVFCVSEIEIVWAEALESVGMWELSRALDTVCFLTIIYLITFTHHWFGHFHHHYHLCLSLIVENYHFIQLLTVIS